MMHTSGRACFFRDLRQRVNRPGFDQGRSRTSGETGPGGARANAGFGILLITRNKRARSARIENSESEARGDGPPPRSNLSGWALPGGTSDHRVGVPGGRYLTDPRSIRLSISTASPKQQGKEVIKQSKRTASWGVKEKKTKKKRLPRGREQKGMPQKTRGGLRLDSWGRGREKKAEGKEGGKSSEPGKAKEPDCPH